MHSSIAKGLLLLTILIYPGISFAQNLQFQFIGNMAFAITDGDVNLYSDFPYESGAFGYMKYDWKKMKISENGVCLITHSHRDHWALEIFRQLKLKVIAPADAQKGIDRSRIIALNDHIDYVGINVKPFQTPHGKIAHYSYLVTWHGIRMYFTGDTEELNTLLSMNDLDVAFISPWLASALLDQSKNIDAKKIVIYHHTENEKVPALKNAIIPSQGQIFQIPFRQKTESY